MVSHHPFPGSSLPVPDHTSVCLSHHSGDGIGYRPRGILSCVATVAPRDLNPLRGRHHSHPISYQKRLRTTRDPAAGYHFLKGPEGTSPELASGFFPASTTTSVDTKHPVTAWALPFQGPLLISSKTLILTKSDQGLVRRRPCSLSRSLIAPHALYVQVVNGL